MSHFSVHIDLVFINEQSGFSSQHFEQSGFFFMCVLIPFEILGSWSEGYVFFNPNVLRRSKPTHRARRAAPNHARAAPPRPGHRAGSESELPGADGGAQMFEEVASDAAKSQRKHKSQGVERLARYSQVSQCFTVKLSQITKSH